MKLEHGFMVDNKLQFAVVREDPTIEFDLVRRMGEQCKVFIIGSGGCTALSLRREFPQVPITVLDPNPVQIELLQKKVRSLSGSNFKSMKEEFGVGSDDPKSLTGSGNFESLFRSFRNFTYEFVCGRDEWVSFFSEVNRRLPFTDTIFKSKYWSVAFQLFFSDPMLLAMFGSNAIQYAPKGSYPSYFQRVLESGLVNPAAKTNYFLHHIFLGHYLDDPKCLPLYLQGPTHDDRGFTFVEADAQSGPNFGEFDVISLSNIFDWMDKPDIVLLSNRLAREMKPGAQVVWRQLNNSSNLQSHFGPSFRFDDALATKLHANDRSLFYSSIHIGQKTKQDNKV